MIITLNREYGAGGHSIGTKVAEELGIELYDKDIIAEVVKKNGVSAEQVAEADEEISRTDTFIRSIVPVSYDMKDSIFETEKSVILDFAKKGPCIILGRCSDLILREAGIDILNVYIYADMECRMKRAAELLGTEDAALIARTIKKHDHNRNSYYSYHSGCHLGEYRNYDLMLNSGLLGYDTCKDIIVKAYKTVAGN